MIGCKDPNEARFDEWRYATDPTQASKEWNETNGNPRDVYEVFPELKAQREKTHQEVLLDTIGKIPTLKEQLAQAREMVLKQSEVFNSRLSEDDKQTLNRIKNYLNDPGAITEINTYAQFLNESRDMLDKFAKEAKLMDTDKSPALVKLAKLHYYREIANSYDKTLRELDAALSNMSSDNPVKGLVKDMIDSQRSITRTYENQAADLVSSILAEQNFFSNKQFLDRTNLEIADMRKKIAGYKAEGRNTQAKYLQDKADKLQSIVDGNVPTKELIHAFLRGEKGDSSLLSYLVEATISNGNPVISSYAKFIKGILNKVRQAFMPTQNRVVDAYYKFKEATGRAIGNNAKFYEGLYHIVDRIVNGVKESYYSLLGEYDGKHIYSKEHGEENYQTTYQRLKDEEQKLRDDGKIEESRAKNKERRTWMATFMEREFTDKYYDVYELLTPEAKEARQELFKKITETSGRGVNGIMNQTDIDEIDSLWKDYKMLGYDYDKYNQLKDEKGLAIAKSVREFNKARAAFVSYELTDKGRATFENLKRQKLDLLNAGIIKRYQYDAWLRANTTREISQQFYSERNKILEELNEKLNTLPRPDNTDKRGKYTELWNQAFATVLKARDEDNIVDGNELDEKQQSIIRELNQQMDYIRRQFVGDEGLSKEERNLLHNLMYKANSNIATEAEINKRNELLVRQKAAREALKGHKGTMGEVAALFGKLMTMQSKSVTEYYKRIKNERYQAFRANILKDNPNALEGEMLQRFKYEDEWYLRNHYKSYEWVSYGNYGQYQEEDRPTYAWTEVLPTEEKYIMKDQPSRKYKERTIKDSYKDENGKTIQIRNPNFKPGPEGYGSMKRKVTIDGKEQDNPYISEDYKKLTVSSSKEDVAKLSLLRELTDTYLAAQKGRGRMGLLLPAVEKEMIDRFQDGQINYGSAKSKVGSVLQGIKRRLTSNEQDADEGIGTALADMSGNEFRYVAQKYTGRISKDDISLNLVASVLKYAYSSEQTKALNEALPVAQALQDVLHTNKIEKESWDAALKQFGILKKIRKGDESNMYRHVVSFTNMIFFNEFQKQQDFLGVNLTKVTNNVMGIAALQILAMNVPAQITNYISGYMQSYIEAAGSRYFNSKGLSNAMLQYKKFYPDLIRDAYKPGKKSLLGQMIELYDVEQGKYDAHLGKNANHSFFKEMTHMPYILKDAGEHELAVSIFLAMANTWQVEQTQKDGSVKKIALFNAYTKDANDNIVLEDGVKFSDEEKEAFNNTLHGIIRKTQGNYDKFNRTGLEKEWWGRLLVYMRKWFIPMAVNRWGTMRYDNEIGDLNEGFYITFWKSFGKDLFTLNKRVLNWEDYTDNEKRAISKTLREVAAVLILTCLVSMMGGGPNQKDEHLADNSFFYNHMLYQLVRLESETENFEPFTGANEIYRQIMTPTVAMNYARTVLKLGTQMQGYVTGQDETFKRDSGYWKEGDSRILASLFSLVGLKGTTLHPDMLINNFNNVQRVR